MPFVVDASVALSWYLEDEVSVYADDILARLDWDSATVPSLWPVEVANGFLVAERRNRVTAFQVSRARRLLRELPIVVERLEVDSLLGDVLNIARTNRLTAYDACYLHLAQAFKIPLATQDAKLRSACAAMGVDILR